MPRTGLLLILLIVCLRGSSQPGEILNLRYNEDFRHLRNDSTPDLYDQLKYTPLNRSATRYLSMGGEVRYQFQYFKNEDWGDNPEEERNAFYTRLLFHSDLHLSSRFRLFTQLNSTFVNGVDKPRSIDENRFDIQQLFADLVMAQNETSHLTLRTGRQELLYGSQRIIAVREGPNNRQSFDAARLLYARQDFSADVFYARPVNVRQGVLDDPFNRNQDLWSIYTVTKLHFIIQHIDVYYIGYRKKDAVFNDGTAEEIRHSAGTRLWGRSPRWIFDTETLCQFGSFGQKRIVAYTASANIAYVLKREKGSLLGIKTEIISGDRREGDHKLETFNPLFPRGAYFGLAALIGPANLVDLHPFVQWDITEKFSLNLDYDMFWRHQEHDGLYGPNAALIYRAQPGNLHIGDQLGISLELNPNQNLSITPEFTWFNSGAYLKNASAGKDVLFAALTIQFKY